MELSGTIADGWNALSGDAGDYSHMQGTVAHATQGTSAAGSPWWQGIAQYGLVRAIDNSFRREAVTGNTQPGTIQGADGRTYTLTPTNAGGVPRRSAGGTASGGGMGDWLLPVLLIGAAFLLLRAK